MDVHNVRLKITDQLPEGAIDWLRPDSLCRYRKSVQGLESVIVLTIFHHFMTVLTEQRRFFHEDQVFATGLLIGVMKSENSHAVSALRSTYCEPKAGVIVGQQSSHAALLMTLP
jgi:hypothetical protein